MMITEGRSLKVSRRVFDRFFENLEYKNERGDLDLRGYMDTFNNCREFGFVLHIMQAIYPKWDDNIKAYTATDSVWHDVYVWAFEDRHSDNICVIVSEKTPTHVSMYSEESYESERKFFKCDNYDEAADYIMRRVEEIYALAKVRKEAERKVGE